MNGEQRQGAGAEVPTESPTAGSADVPKRRKLSRREAYRLALHHAITDRESMAEAWDSHTAESQDAAWLASEFKRVLAEAFGERTVEDALAASGGKGTPLPRLLNHPPQDFCATRLSLKLPLSPAPGRG